uniref:Cytochrome P450 n=1 Tax=Ditylenchus dipsaci TaxID=166011 RepID=A0A915CM23_9BILA
MVEVDTIIETINNDLCNTTKLKNKPLHLFPLIDVAIGSIINQIVFGYRFIGETRKEFYELKAVMDEQTHMFTHPICVVLFAMPCLRYLPVFSHYFNRVKQRRRRKEAEKSSFKEDDTYFVDAFLHEIEIRKSLSGNTDEEDKLFNHESLRGLCHDLFNAGQETTANTLNFVILYMIVYPEKQTKMQEELDRIMGDNEGGTRRVSLADKSKLPYTNAVINETQRFCNLVPLNLIHRTTKDVECAGFKLPKGTRITPMISTVLYDQKIFPNLRHLFLNASWRMVN